MTKHQLKDLVYEFTNSHTTTKRASEIQCLIGEQCRIQCTGEDYISYSLLVDVILIDNGHRRELHEIYRYLPILYSIVGDRVGENEGMRLAKLEQIFQ